MICTKCGAPIPAGMDKCPYCGAKSVSAGPGPMAGDETAFAGEKETEFAGQAFGETEFAGWPGKTADRGADRTELADSWPTAAPLKQPRRTKAPKAPRHAPKGRKAKQTPKKAAGEPARNNLLRFVLLGILAVLIIVLLLR